MAGVKVIFVALFIYCSVQDNPKLSQIVGRKCCLKTDKYSHHTRVAVLASVTANWSPGTLKPGGKTTTGPFSVPREQLAMTLASTATQAWWLYLSFFKQHFLPTIWLSFGLSWSMESQRTSQKLNAKDGSFAIFDLLSAKGYIKYRRIRTTICYDNLH